MNDMTKAHTDFNALWSEMREDALQYALDAVEVGNPITRQTISAWLFIDALGETSNGMFDGKFTKEQKANLLEMAESIGPDWAQVFYHIAVFMTRVA